MLDYHDGALIASELWVTGKAEAAGKLHEGEREGLEGREQLAEYVCMSIHTRPSSRAGVILCGVTRILGQAETLVHDLNRKVKNVKMHLSDVHRDMSYLHHDEKEIKAQVQQLEERQNLGKSLRALENEMQQLLGNSDRVKSQMAQLNAQRNDYRQRIDEVRQVLTQIKKKHLELATGNTKTAVRCFSCPSFSRWHALSSYDQRGLSRLMAR